MAAEPPITPNIFYDPESDKVFPIKLIIEGLQVVNNIRIQLAKCSLGRESNAENAKLDVQFTTRGFTFQATGTSGVLQGKNYRLKVENLPADIDPKLSKFKPVKDCVMIKLHKVSPGKWMDGTFQQFTVVKSPEENSPSSGDVDDN